MKTFFMNFCYTTAYQIHLELIAKVFIVHFICNIPQKFGERVYCFDAYQHWLSITQSCFALFKVCRMSRIGQNKVN